MNRLQSLKFTETATLTFVPTAAGATGAASIESFLLANEKSLALFFPKQSESASESITLKYSFKTPQFAVEEALVRFEFDQPLEWVLPGIRPNKTTVQVPVVSCFTFSGEEVASLRVYWDQATVLRQIGLIPSDPSKLPLNRIHPVVADIVPILNGNQTAGRYLDESRGANPLLHQLSGMIESGIVSPKKPAAPSSTRKQNMGDLLAGNCGPESLRPSTRLNSKYVGGKSHIFDEDSEQPKQRHVDPRRYETHFSIGDVSDQLASTVKLADDEDHKSERQHYRFPGNQSHFTLAHDSTVSKPITSDHPSPQKNKQTFSIWESSSNGGGTVQNRPSSRVLRAPGGGSSIQLF